MYKDFWVEFKAAPVMYLICVGLVIITMGLMHGFSWLGALCIIVGYTVASGPALWIARKVLNRG